MAKIGDFIGGEYEILKKQDVGGMSNIYIAMKTNLNKTWCIKELVKNPHDPGMKIKVEQALKEVRIMDGLKHEYLPSIVDYFDTPEALYIVMDHVEGEDLKKVLVKHGAQNQEDVIRWAKQLCEALHYLHSHNPPIIYRDMKPNNIMLKPDGNIKLIDFGVAKEYKETATKDTHMYATDGYAAPEQCSGGKTDARTDIYSLGVTMFYLLTNVDPQKELYVQTPIREYNPSLSGGLENIILKCTMLNPHERYQSASELLDALEHYQIEDDDYLLGQRKKVLRFGRVLGCGVLSLLLSIGCLFVEKQLNTADYEEQIALAETANQYDEKISHYHQAISIKPLSLEPYFSLIELYKMDGFTLEEEQAFKKVLNVHLTELQKGDEYGRLAFEIGKLYWYYYDYGNTDDNTVRAISATKWFKDAASKGKDKDYYTMANAYCQIGEFYSSITQKVEEADDKNMYQSLFEGLEQLYDAVDQDNKTTSEIVKLESGKLIIGSLQSYAKKMSMDGVKKGKMIELYRNCSSYLQAVETSTDKTNELKTSIISQLESCLISIENAYRDVVVEVKK